MRQVAAFLLSFGLPGIQLVSKVESEALLRIESPMSPPEWALLERELIQANSDAIVEFYATYNLYPVVKDKLTNKAKVNY